jgi:HK97 family phage major capsid protein
MSTPTLEDVARLERRREQIRAAAENMLLECRAAGRTELNAGEAHRMAQAKADLAALDEHIAEVRSEVERVGSLPPNLAARVESLSSRRPVRGGMTGGMISPLAPPMDELRRLFDAAERRQSASYEKRFTSADSLLPPELFPQVTAMQHEQRLLNKLPAWQTEMPSVEFVRHVSTTGSGASVAEGALKPLVTLNVDKLVLATVKLAAVLSLTREIYTDWDAFSQYALAELQRLVIDTENASLLAGDGVGTDMTGFYATPGILTHDVSADTGTNVTTWDSLEKCIAELRTGPALATPDLLVLHPEDWSSIRRIKDAYGRYLAAPDPSDDEVNTAWGCDVLVTTQNPIGQGLFIDTSKFGRVAIREPLGMFIGFINDDFQRNLISWAAETRLVLCVERPAAVLAITKLPAPTAADATKSSTGRK